MAKAQKATAVVNIAEYFKSSSSVVVTEYCGLTMTDLMELRRSLSKFAKYIVTKNTLAKRAANKAGIEGLDGIFVGSTAIAFVSDELTNAAKIIKEFAQKNKSLVIKGGYINGKALAVSEIEKIADLESREVILLRLANLIKFNLVKFVNLIKEPTSRLARISKILQEKKLTK